MEGTSPCSLVKVMSYYFGKNIMPLNVSFRHKLTSIFEMVLWKKFSLRLLPFEQLKGVRHKFVSTIFESLLFVEESFIIFWCRAISDSLDISSIFLSFCIYCPVHFWIPFFILKHGQSPDSFCLFSSLSQYNDKYSIKFDYKSIEGVIGIRIRDHGMVGANESTELWWPPISFFI